MHSGGGGGGAQGRGAVGVVGDSFDGVDGEHVVDRDELRGERGDDELRRRLLPGDEGVDEDFLATTRKEREEEKKTSAIALEVRSKE